MWPTSASTQIFLNDASVLDRLGLHKTDRRDCQWIQRLHRLGMLPSVLQPDEATQTLRDYVRQRGNLVRLSGQHIQRMQKALELMNLKLTKVVGDITAPR